MLTVIAALRILNQAESWIATQATDYRDELGLIEVAKDGFELVDQLEEIENYISSLLAVILTLTEETDG